MYSHPLWRKTSIPILTHMPFASPYYAIATLNFQHNCNDGKCVITINHRQTNEALEGLTKVYSVNHRIYNGYILNVASLRHPEVYRRLSQLEFPSITASMWEESIQNGVDEWKDNSNQKPKRAQPKDARDQKVPSKTKKKNME
jgi:succinate dehydrogenase/fumarate reductase-like Fe-S protein